jgi:hypothetical protein
MWTSPRPALCRRAQRVLSLASLTLVVALSGCGAPDESGRTPQRASAGPVSGEVPVTASATPDTSPLPAPVTAVTRETPTAAPSSMIAMPTQPAQSRDRASPPAEPASVQSTPGAQPMPIELIGTGISGANAFAVVRNGDQDAVTVHAGESIGDYAVTAIEPARITLRSPDSREQVVMLHSAGANGVSAMPSASTARQTATNRALIAAGINTDQSIPANVPFGPTARLPDGVKPTVH